MKDKKWVARPTHRKREANWGVGIKLALPPFYFMLLLYAQQRVKVCAQKTAFVRHSYQ
ncbi:MAG: hypothetical protein ACI9LX_002859 [Paraglaciecola sp.]|jgi:hypothetical protein